MPVYRSTPTEPQSAGLSDAAPTTADLSELRPSLSSWSTTVSTDTREASVTVHSPAALERVLKEIAYKRRGAD